MEPEKAKPVIDIMSDFNGNETIRNNEVSLYTEKLETARRICGFE